jgi:acyl-CoA synthetase (NDP forming)
MNLTVAYEPITELLRNAYAEGRQFLYEYEVYNLLSLSGSETPPKCSFIPRNARLADEEAMAMPGDKAVLKIVSPTIIHKTEVGGVRIVPKTPDKVRSAVRRMLSEVPERYAEWIERHRRPQELSGVGRGRAAKRHRFRSQGRIAGAVHAARLRSVRQ